MPRTLDDLGPDAFERLINDLLFAEYSNVGRFVPFATRSGDTDGGYDASFDGPLDGGPPAHWTVSAKFSVAKRARSAVDGRIKADVDRHPDRQWWVVTNVRVPPNDPMRRPDGFMLHLTARQDLETLLRAHGWVARAYGLGSAVGQDLLRPGSEQTRPRLPPKREDELAEIRRRLDAGKQRIVVVGAVGSSAPDLARALAFDLYRTPTTTASPRVPVYVEAPQPAQLSVLAASALELAAEPGAYVVVVPPSPLALDVARLIRVDRPDRALVAFLSPGQAPAFPEDPTYERIELEPLSPDELRDWVRALHPTSREDWLAMVVAFSGDRPEAAAALLGTNGGIPAVRDAVGDVIDRVRDEGAAGVDALGWILLLLPFAATDAPDLRAVAERAGVEDASVTRILATLDDDQLVRTRGSRIEERSPALVGALLQRLIRPSDHRRFTAGVSALPAALQWTAARRLAQFTDLERPLIDQLGALTDQVATGEFSVAQKAVRAATDVARLSLPIAAAAAGVADAARDRLRRPAPFEGTSGWSAGYLGTLSTQFATDAARLIATVGWWTERVGWAVDALMELHRADPTFDLVALGKQLADPLNPRPGHTTAVVERIERQAADVRAALAIAALLGGVAERLLGDAIPVSGTVGMTLRFTSVPWSQHPEVIAWRDKIVQLLVKSTASGLGEGRAAAWAGLRRLWDSQAHGGRPSEKPDDLEGLAEFVLCRVEGAFGESDYWDGWKEAERVVLDYLARGLASTGRLGRALAAFPTDPAYRAWRLMAGPDSLVDDPVCIGGRVASGDAGWSEVVHGMAMFRPGRTEVLRAAAEQVADRITTVDGLVGLLDRVAATLEREPSAGWLGSALLREWIDLRPELFREVLLGAGWRRVPSTLRAAVLHAGRDAFGDELRQRISGPVVSGAQLGAALDLVPLLERPESVPPTEVAHLLPSLVLVAPLEARAPALFGLAGHPDAGVRGMVAHALSDWLVYRAPKPDPGDAVSIVRRLTERAAGAPAADTRLPDDAVRTLVAELGDWPNWPESDPSRAPDALRRAVEVEVGWAIVATVLRGDAWPEPERVWPFVDAALAADSDRWLDALSNAVEHPEWRDLAALSPARADVDHLRRIMARASDGHPLSRWLPAVRGSLGLLDARQVAALAADALDADRVDDAVTLVSAALPTGTASDPTWSAMLERLIERATPEQIGSLIDQIARGEAGYPLHVDFDGWPFASDPAAPWRQAADRAPPAVASVLGRIADRIEGIVHGLAARVVLDGG
ncbi:MAG: hypothetical protein ABMB14_09545 [Myxococcota bacterium]